MSLLQNYHQYGKSLSEVEDYCFNHILQINEFQKGLTIQWLANELNVSTTTIYRMCKKLGYDSFKDFRFDILFHKRDNFETVKAEDNPLHHIQKQTEETFQRMAQLDIKKMTQDIKTAETVLICSTGMNNHIAKILSTKLSLMGIHNIYPEDQWFMFLTSAHLKVGDMVIVLSRGGETPELIRVVKSAKVNKAKVLLIGEVGSSTLGKLSDYKMIVACVENEGYDIDTRLQMHLAVHYLTKELLETNS